MKIITMLGIMLLLSACGSSSPQADTSAQTTQSDSTAQTQNNLNQENPNQDTSANSDTAPTTSQDKIELDLDKLNTGVAQADLTNYPYPFETNSTAVQNYATAYQITPQEAQHAMTLSMASPEGLNKVLDQIVGEYVGHSLTDGKDMSLVIYTTDKVTPITFDYVIADKFGEGLVLPIKLTQISQTKDQPQVDAQTMVDKFHSPSEAQ